MEPFVAGIWNCLLTISCETVEDQKVKLKGRSLLGLVVKKRIKNARTESYAIIKLIDL